jgi:histone H3/H4
MADESEWDAILAGVVDEDFEPTPENITPVADLAELHVGQAATKLVIIESGKLRPYIKESTKASLRTLKQHEMDIREAPGRFANQIMNVARTAALMRGSAQVSQEDINLALQDKLTGTLAGNGISDLDDIRPVIDDVLAKVN